MQRVSFVFLILLGFGVLALDYCGRNMISTPCRNSCESTCGQLKPKYCSKICKVNGCVCKPGYIRRDENGACIPKKWCRIVAEKWKWSPLTVDSSYEDTDSGIQRILAINNIIQRNQNKREKFCRISIF